MKILRLEQLEPRTMLHGEETAEFQLDEQYDLRSDGGNEWLNYNGLNEKWVIAAEVSPPWFFIEPDGDLRHWQNDGTPANDPLIATLPTADYDDISLLYDAFHEHSGNHDNPQLEAEHQAVMALVPVEDATRTAVQSGDWDSSSTWGAPVPSTDSRVVIPEGITVTLDSQQFVASQWIRVDGTLQVAENVATQLIFETMVITETGSLINHSNVSSKFIFRDSGPIDTEYDPFALSRGLISHGVTDIEGVDKTDWTTFEPTAVNASTITVDDATGWEVGDTILIGDGELGEAPYYYYLANTDETRTISSISGSVITLSAPLAYAHDAVEWQDPVVANLTRNITFSSQNTAVARRGHVMLMHNDQHSVKNATLKDLGRTDKSFQVSDPDGEGNGLENPRGRYALHFHRTGGDSEASVASGNVIIGSPGWGLVNHDSNVLADSNVVYNVFGAAFVAELGTETGEFTNNAAIRSNGTNGSLGEVRLNHDTGHQGVGWWIESGHVITDGNIAIGHAGAGFAVFATGATLSDPEHHDIAFNLTNNVSLASDSAVSIWASRFAANLTVPFEGEFSQVTGNLFEGVVVNGYPSCIDYRDNTIVPLSPHLTPYGVVSLGVFGHVNYYDNIIKGFKVGVQVPTEGYNTISGGYYDNLRTNIQVYNTQNNRHRRVDITDVTFGDSAIWNIEMTPGFFQHNWETAYPHDPYWTTPVPDYHHLFTDYGLGADSHITLDGVSLFFEEQARDFAFGELFTRFPDEIRYEPDGVTFATGESLNARNLIVGGVALPEGEQYYLPKIRGVFVDES